MIINLWCFIIYQILLTFYDEIVPRQFSKAVMEKMLDLVEFQSIADLIEQILFIPVESSNNGKEF